MSARPRRTGSDAAIGPFAHTSGSSRGGGSRAVAIEPRTWARECGQPTQQRMHLMTLRKDPVASGASRDPQGAQKTPLQSIVIDCWKGVSAGKTLCARRDSNP